MASVFSVFFHDFLFSLASGPFAGYHVSTSFFLFLSTSSGGTRVRPASAHLGLRLQSPRPRSPATTSSLLCGATSVRGVCGARCNLRLRRTDLHPFLEARSGPGSIVYGSSRPPPRPSSPGSSTHGSADSALHPRRLRSLIFSPSIRRKAQHQRFTSGSFRVDFRGLLPLCACAVRPIAPRTAHASLAAR